MGLPNNIDKDHHALEIVTYTLLQEIYPNALVTRDGHTIRGPDRKPTTPDILFSLGNPVSVLLELTTLPISCLHKNNKDHQREAVNYYLERNPDYRALFFYGECYFTANGLYQSIKILEALAEGKMSSTRAQDNVDKIAESSKHMHIDSRFKWNPLYDKVKYEFAIRTP